MDNVILLKRIINSGYSETPKRKLHAYALASL